MSSRLRSIFDRRAARLGWGVADQAVSSLRNFLLGVYVAKSLGAEGLGALGLALVAFVMTLNGSRALSTDPLMIRYSGAPTPRWRDAVSRSGGVALLMGACGGIVTIAVGAALLSERHVEAGGAFIAMGVSLPGLALQDSWRYAFFASGEGAKTFVNDLVWMVLLITGLVACEVTGTTGTALAVLAFGGSATLAALLGMVQARTVPDPRAAKAWLRQHYDLGPRFFVENLVLAVDGQIRPIVVVAVAGLAAAGAIRGAEMLVGPIAALLMGIAQVAVPEAARTVQRGRRALARLCLTLSLGLAAGALAWGAVVLVVFPHGPGEALLATVWDDARALFLGVIISTAFGCMHVGPSAGLRALGRADKSMRCQLAASVLFIALASAGAFAWGAQGAVWGTAVAAAIGAGIWWSQLGKASREHFVSVHTQEPVSPPDQVQAPEPSA